MAWPNTCSHWSSLWSTLQSPAKEAENHLPDHRLPGFFVRSVDIGESCRGSGKSGPAEEEVQSRRLDSLSQQVEPLK